MPLANRYSFFGPAALACEAALGFPQPVPAIAVDGWRRLDDVPRRSWPARSGRCATRRGRSSTRWPRPRARSCTATPSSATSASGPDGRTILVDWSMTGAGPPIAELVHYLALNRARIPEGYGRDAAIDAYRAALERHGIDTEPWFERQLALCLVGVMLQLGWEKAFDETGADLAWWRDRTVDTAVSSPARRSASQRARAGSPVRPWTERAEASDGECQSRGRAARGGSSGRAGRTSRTR